MYIKQLMDALALLLVDNPGPDTVTACALEKVVADGSSPAKRLKMTTGSFAGVSGDHIRLVIARNGTFSDENNSRLLGHVTQILEFISNGI